MNKVFDKVEVDVSWTAPAISIANQDSYRDAKLVAALNNQQTAVDQVKVTRQQTDMTAMDTQMHESFNNIEATGDSKTVFSRQLLATPAALATQTLRAVRDYNIATLHTTQRLLAGYRGLTALVIESGTKDNPVRILK